MPKILIAEDNVALSNVMRFHLERSKYDVKTVNNGKSAVDTLENEKFDLLITDHQMPKMSGIDACAAIRDGTINAEIPIILLTAKQMELEVSSLKQKLGIQEVFPKPFSPTQIVQQVEKILSRDMESNDRKLSDSIC